MAKDAPLWFLLSILTCSSWQRHRPRFTHWETIGVGWVGKGVRRSWGAASPGHLPLQRRCRQARCRREGSAEVASEGSPLGQSQQGRGPSPWTSRDDKAPSSRHPSPRLPAWAVAEMGGAAPGAALVEAQEEVGEPGGSPVGVLALGGRAGQRRSPFAQSRAERPASHRSVGATPTAAEAWGLPLRIWAGVRLARRR